MNSLAAFKLRITAAEGYMELGMPLEARGGFNHRNQTWRAICERYPAMTPAHDGGNPWENPLGATFELPQPDNLLRYIHVLPNESDEFGCRDLQAVGSAVGRALDIAERLKVQSVGFIHIPVAFDGGVSENEEENIRARARIAPAYYRGRAPTKEQDAMSAAAMIGALGEWDDNHSGIIQHAHLIDIGGYFGPFVAPVAGGPCRLPRHPDEDIPGQSSS